MYTSKSTVPIPGVISPYISPTNFLALIRITQQDNLQAESEGFANKGATSEMTFSFLFLSLLTKFLSFYVSIAWSHRFMEWNGAEKLHTGLSPLTNRYQVCIMPPLPQIDSRNDNNDSKTENEKKKAKINKSRTE